MPKTEFISLPQLMFELGKLFAQFRFSAEAMWCVDEHDKDGVEINLNSLQVKAKRLEKKVSSVARSLKSGKAPLVAFASAIDSFWIHFRRVWRERQRQSQLVKVRDVEPEEQHRRDFFLIKRSPMTDGHWSALQHAAEAALDSMDADVKAIFDLAELTESEVFQTFTTRQGLRGARSRRDASKSLYYTVRFDARVRSMIQELLASFPYFASVKLELGNIYVPVETEQRIVLFMQQIESLLRNPLKAPGYLNLVLDRHRGIVWRRGNKVELTRKRLWDILILLEKSGDEICQYDTIDRAWPTNERFNLQIATREKGISELRRILRPLGLTIKSTRGEGYRLQGVS